MKSIFYITAIAATVLCQSCGKHEEAVKETGGISDSIIKTVITAPATFDDKGGYLKLNGKIEPDEARQAKVFALVSGKVQSVNVELGDYVEKGQLLAVIKSSEVAGIANDVSIAESNLAQAEKGLATTKDLYAGNLVSSQAFMEAKMNYNKAVSELNRAKQVAVIVGGENSQYVIKAPISGFVIQKNITGNSDVRQDNNTELFSIADLSQVWVMANVYEADMNNVQLNDTVQVNTLSDPDKTLYGKIDKIYSVLDPATRTMQVRITLKNPGNVLKPEMYAAVKVQGRSSSRGLIIPSQAIIMDNSRNYVVVKKNNELEVKTINLLNRVDSKAYITGLNAGDQVVINSQVFLYQALTNN